MTIYGYGWACDDCLFFLANGDTPQELDEEQTAAWVAAWEKRNAGYDVTLGGEHEDGCPNMGPDGAWIGDTDCSCEQEEFSWRSCDTCGSTLGGSRDAVTFFTRRKITHTEIEILRQHDADTRQLLFEQMPDATDAGLNELIQTCHDPVVVAAAQQLLTERVVDQAHALYPDRMRD